MRETVEIQRQGALGILTLRRPEALNALDLSMVRALAAALDEWEQGSAVRAVLLRGAGERGLCAGGDVRALFENIAGGELSAVTDFFREEYALNARIARYRHPIVALAEGITMGGGIGLAGHASVRVVTETSALAMPETRIGFTPDVGGSWLLGRGPGRVGEYLALTGSAVGAADAIAIGLADHHVPRERLDGFIAALVAGAEPSAAAAAAATAPAPGCLTEDREWIDAAFGGAGIDEIVAALRVRDEEAARAAADALDALSPTALAVTLEAVRRTRELPDLRSALSQEYGLAMWFATTQADLREGIRAQLIDKDRAPRWHPSSRADLPADLLDRAFGYVPPVPLWS